MKIGVYMLTVLLVLVGVLENGTAETIHVSGDVSGTWTADTVMVDGEVRVPPGATLNIEPGVEVLFTTHCRFIIDSGALLRAVGTATDSIRFDHLNPDSTWHGLRFTSASDSCALCYCQIRNGYANSGGTYDRMGGGIMMQYCRVTISNCLIERCQAIQDGGGIFFEAPSGNTTMSPLITHSTIRNCRGGGGGMYLWRGAPRIQESVISGNHCNWQGGGMLLYFCRAVVDGNTIIDNYGHNNGGGISNLSSASTITNNIILRNETVGDGGGIYIYSPVSTPAISGNTIGFNHAGGYGGGIASHSYNPSPAVGHNVIIHNSAGYGGGLYVRSSGSYWANTIVANSASWGGGVYVDTRAVYRPTFEDNQISCNEAYSGGGGYYVKQYEQVLGYPRLINETVAYNEAPEGAGMYFNSVAATVRNAIVWGNSPAQVFMTADSSTAIVYSDIQGVLWPGTGNISADPLFWDYGCMGDYHLQMGSPCIDSGDPAATYNDPDGTRADMGCYYYQDMASLLPRTPTVNHAELVLHQAQPNPFMGTTTLSFSLPEAGLVRIDVYDATGAIVSTLVDRWMTSGSHIVPFDGAGLTGGLYFCRLRAGDQVATRKVVLVR